MTVALRPYQEEALAAITAAQARGVNRSLVALPTGTGKTVCFSSLIQQRGGTALILAHRDELLKQAADKLRTVAPELGMSIGFVQAKHNDVAAPVVIASVQTLARQNRLDRLPNHFDTVIVDEAHHATADSYRRILEHVHGDLAVGFTATPERADKQHLSEVWEEIVYARSLLDMIEAGYLANLRGLRVELHDLDLSTVKTSRGDYQANDLGRALQEAHAPDHTAAALLEHAQDRTTVVFVPTVALAHQTARAITAAGIEALAVWGDMPTEERHTTLGRLSAGDLQCVVNVDVLTEGWDEPRVDCIAIAAPTRSRIAYVQRVGRGTRLHPGKADCLILDLVGVTNDLKLQSLPCLFDLKAPPKPDETVTQAVAREAAEAEAEAAGEITKSRRRKAFAAELWDRSRMKWIEVGDRWVTSFGDSQFLALDPYDDVNWRVLLIRPTGARILATGLDLGYAQGAAEETVRRAGKVTLVDSKARWRSAPVSTGQAAMLRRLGAGSAATKGEAADLITEALGRQMLAKLDRALAGEPQPVAAVA